MTAIEDLIGAYGLMLEERVNEGWVPNMLTLKFRPMSGSPQQRWQRMEAQIERVYAIHLTRVVRDPRSPTHAWLRPIWIAVPDFPVAKTGRGSKRLVLPSDGQHAHVMTVMPERTRLGCNLQDHFEERQSRYTNGVLSHVHVEPITRNLGYVVRYAFKAIAKGLASTDEILVLPCEIV